MERMNDVTCRPLLRLVNDDMLDDVAVQNEQENLPIARRLANDPSPGITRVTVIGVSGTHVIEPNPVPTPALIVSRASDSDAPAGRRGIRNVLRHLLWKKKTS